jgi:hypothetical protein
LGVSQFTFSAIWPAENAISAHSLTGVIMSMILEVLVLGFEIAAKTTTFSMST